MIKPPWAKNEPDRLACLYRLEILDTVAEERFDRITRLAQSIFDVKIVLVSLIDKDRQWFKSKIGLAAEESDRDTSFCGHAIVESELFEIEDARQDTRFFDNPAVTGEPYVRFYAGAQLRSEEGYALGTLCLVHDQPRKLEPKQRQQLRELADIVEREIQLVQLEQTQASWLSVQRQLTERESLLRTIIDNLPVNIYVKDKNHRKVLANQSEQDFTGVASEADLIGKSDADLYQDERLVRFGYQEDCRVIEQGETVQMQLSEGVTKEGEKAWFNVSKYPLHNADGEIAGLVGISIDMTEQEDAKARMARQLAALQLLSSIASNTEIDLNEQFRSALKVGRHFIKMETAIISQVRDEEYRIRWLAAEPESALREQQCFELGSTYCSLTLAQGGELLIDSMAQSEFRNHPCYQEQGVESYIGVALEVSGRVAGTLSFSSVAARERVFDDSEMLFVRLLGRWVSATLERIETSQRLQRLMTQVPGMFYQFQRWPDGRSLFPFCSPGVQDIYGLSPDQVLEDSSLIWSKIHPDDVTGLAQAVKESEKNLSVLNCQYRVFSKDERYRWIESIASPARLADGSTIWHGYSQDIHQRKVAEKLKSEFVSTVSHELRTPLTSISGSLGLIDSGALGDVPAKVKELVGIARKNSERLYVLINDLLDIEKLDAGKLDLELKPHQLKSLICQSLEANQSYADQYGVSLQLDDGAEPAMTLIDDRRFQQIMSNLISNAIKFSETGGVVRLNWQTSDAFVTVAVADSGIGIAEAFQARVFERFTQADGSDRRAKGGTGLGLAISQELAALMHADIFFESAEGAGTTFYLRLPLHTEH